MYMPVRQRAAEEVRHAWDTLEESLAGTQGEVMAGGDMNAETEAYLEVRGVKLVDATLSDCLAVAELKKLANPNSILKGVYARSWRRQQETERGLALSVISSKQPRNGPKAGSST